MTEIWREVAEAPDYEVSNLGRVRSVITDRVLKTSPNTAGYIRITIWAEEVLGYRKKIHRGVARLVAEAFLSDFDSALRIGYKDGDKTNCRADNLYIQDHGARMLDDPYMFVEIIETGERFDNCSDAARHVGGFSSGVNSVIHGRQKSYKGYTYRYVSAWSR